MGTDVSNMVDGVVRVSGRVSFFFWFCYFFYIVRK